ncbi:MAG: T9SS type A sorting domain-containing protein, partial [Ignavibacteriaceae bacterium]
ETVNGVPAEFTLSQNYPNPFNPATTIKYGITERTFVELRIYDILGREVVLLVNEEQDAGYYKVIYNATKLASGIYFYRLQAGSFIKTKKMVLMK